MAGGRAGGLAKWAQAQNRGGQRVTQMELAGFERGAHPSSAGTEKDMSSLVADGAPRRT